MTFKRFMLLFGLLVAGVLPGAAPVAHADGMRVTCEDGRGFDGGTALVVLDMPARTTYAANALGIDGFDPVLALPNAQGVSRCNDDDDFAADYSVDLPSAGRLEPSSSSARLRFDGRDSGDVVLVVGSFAGAGEVVLLLEGLRLGTDEAHRFRIVPPAGAALTVYAIARQSSFDPVLTATLGGTVYTCDNAGVARLCDGRSVDLSEGFVTSEAGRVPGFRDDAMLTLPASVHGGRAVELRVSGYGGIRGNYVLVLHTQTGEQALVSPPVPALSLSTR